jgi:hypothetical protein
MGEQRPSHHESREAVPGIQAALLAGIIIGVVRFRTLPNAMIVIVLQLVDRPCVERCEETDSRPQGAYVGCISEAPSIFFNAVVIDDA